MAVGAAAAEVEPRLRKRRRRLFREHFSSVSVSPAGRLPRGPDTTQCGLRCPKHKLPRAASSAIRRRPVNNAEKGSERAPHHFLRPPLLINATCVFRGTGAVRCMRVGAACRRVLTVAQCRAQTKVAAVAEVGGHAASSACGGRTWRPKTRRR